MVGIPAYAIESAIESARDNGAEHVVVVSNGDFKLVQEDDDVSDVYEAMKSSNEFLAPKDHEVSIGVVSLG